MSEAWDVVIVGAGPAGAMAAHAAASRGARVLLVDKATFPRGKVCGCCINAAALATLERAGLGDVPLRCGAVKVDEVLLVARGRRATLALPVGVALSREALDAALIEEAVTAGVVFMPGVHARLGAFGRTLTCLAAEAAKLSSPWEGEESEDSDAKRRCRNPLPLPGGGQTHRFSDASGEGSNGPTRTIYIDNRPHTAQVVIAADGLAGTLLDGEPGMDKCIAHYSRMGAGAVLDDAPAFYCDGRIHMACSAHGYVGLVRVEDGRLDVAAAFDVSFVQACGAPGAAADSVIREAGLPAIATMASAKWRGTPALTRRRKRVAGHRVLAVGDAAGYVEPFTGEGIAWALATGCAAGQIAASRWHVDTPRQWDMQYRRLTSRRRWTCRMVTLGLRQPWVMRTVLELLAARPGLAWPMLRAINTAGT